MPSITFYNGTSLLKKVEATKGRTILATAKQGRVALRHKCGGKASCLTCKVTIPNQSAISAPEPKEARKLGESNLEKGIRLSCQTRVYGDIEAVIPEDPYKARIRALLEQARQE